MKSCVIFFDCHGNEIMNYLEHNKKFIKDFNIEIILINEYVNNNQLSNNSKLEEEHIIKIKNADILILQVIEKDRGFLNNSEIIKLCKSDCKVIKIPHYRNSIYYYKCIENKNNKHELLYSWRNNMDQDMLPSKINDINDINETKKIIKNKIDIMNNFQYDRDEIFKSMNDKIKEFEKIDSLSDIKMLDYFNNNFKKHRLFQGRSYPSSIFFFELSNRILHTLKYKRNILFKDTFFAQNTGEPIPEYWYNYCEFSFDNTHFIRGNIPITECEWYYILLLSDNSNIISTAENLKYLKIIRKS